MRRILLILLALPVLGIAQSNKLVIDLGGQEIGHDIEVTKSGTILVSGLMTLDSAGFHTDGFIAEFDANLNLIRSKRLGGLANDGGNPISVIQTPFEEIIYSGRFNSASNPQSKSRTVFKLLNSDLTATGNEIQFRSFNFGQADLPREIGFLSNGDILALTTNGYGGGNADVSILRMDQNLNLLSILSFGNSGNDHLHSFVETSNGIFMVGSDDNSSYNNGGLMAKMNPNFNWAYSYHYSHRSAFIGSASDELGNIYAHGFVETPSRDREMLLAKFDPSGNMVWAKAYGSQDYDHGTSLIELNGHLYCLGTLGSSMGLDDILLSKFDLNGNHIWSRIIGGTGNEDLPIFGAVNFYADSISNRLWFTGGEVINGDLEAVVYFTDSSGAGLCEVDYAQIGFQANEVSSGFQKVTMNPVFNNNHNQVVGNLPLVNPKPTIRLDTLPCPEIVDTTVSDPGSLTMEDYQSLLNDPDTTQQDTTIILPCNPRFPNVFTPNLDGNNDEFGLNLDCEPILFQVQIFNRWGDLIYTLESKEEMWNGMNRRNQLMSEGVYFYTYQIQGPYERHRGSGFVHLIR